MQTVPTGASAAIQLPGGRKLTYGEYGDPHGKPVLLMPGFPDSRLTRYPDDALTASLGVRLIIPDRPGIGGSDFAPARSLVDRVDDVAQLADQLGIDRFAVLGWSAGGPYALACAARLGDSVTRAGVACGFAPMDRTGATEGMTKEMRRGIPVMRHLPWLLGPMMSSLAKQYARDPEKAFEKQFASGISAADAEVMARPALRENLMAGAKEAMRQGGRGPALDMRLVFGLPWSFRPEDIKSDVWLWYGDADGLIPLQMAQYLDRVIPHSHLTVYPGEGHMLFYTRWADILRTLTAR